MKSDNIILIGMAGTGKSTIGEALARKLGWSFVDSDTCIVEREGMPIPILFGQYGEPYFRQAESEVLEDLLAGAKQVIATGGGAVLAERNREVMLACGLVVALLASAETIVARVTGDLNRPLLKGNPAVEVPLLMERRKHAYDFAPVRVHTDGRNVDEIVIEIESARSKMRV